MDIIGIDCATEPRNVGLAHARLCGRGCELVAAELGKRRPSPAQTVAKWLKDSGPTLLALDAPLGWPSDLGGSLFHHEAGKPLVPDPNLLFRRETDRSIKERIGKQPLDVGADRIARTAHSALRLLDELRDLSKRPIPLAWSWTEISEPVAIEVYPAATLEIRGISSTGYKEPRNQEHRSRREEIADRIGKEIEINAALRECLVSRADILDAVGCVLAGWDFLRGLAPGPEDNALARREGWIWVPSPP